MLKKANTEMRKKNLQEEGEDESECQDEQKQCSAQEHQGRISKLYT